MSRLSPAMTKRGASILLAAADIHYCDKARVIPSECEGSLESWYRIREIPRRLRGSG
jgi:hypothetical protein